MSIADYSMAHRELWDDINYYGRGEQMENTNRQVALCIRRLEYLNGLNPAYVDIHRRALHCQEGLLDFNALVQELTKEESHSKLHPSLRALLSELSALLSRPSSVNALSSKPKPKLIFSYLARAGTLRKSAIISIEILDLHRMRQRPRTRPLWPSPPLHPQRVPRQFPWSTYKPI